MIGIWKSRQGTEGARGAKGAKGSACAGFTLVELMIVVAIVAVLVAVAVVSYGKYVNNGRVVEAQKLVGQIQTLQEQYFQANGVYCNASTTSCTSTSAPTWHPTTAAGMEAKTWDPAGSSLTGWTTLGMSTIETGRTYFSLVTSAGVSSDTFALRGDASSLGLTAGTPWFYVKARADMNADGAPYTEISATNIRTQIIVRNQGE